MSMTDRKIVERLRRESRYHIEGTPSSRRNVAEDLDISIERVGGGPEPLFDTVPSQSLPSYGFTGFGMR